MSIRIKARMSERNKIVYQLKSSITGRQYNLYIYLYFCTFKSTNYLILDYKINA